MSRSLFLISLFGVMLCPLSAQTPCDNGMAGSYPCDKIDLQAFMSNASIGGGNSNDIWGWTDPVTDREYALAGKTGGTAFIDITDPVNPIYLGFLSTHTSSSSWRDIKVYSDHAYIVSEASNHGMQIFDLTQLRGLGTPSPPIAFSETAFYGEFGNAHNIVINEETAFAYGVGTDDCSGGLHMVDISDPVNPSFVGCFSSDGYTHDAQVVIYQGPDTNYQGREIAFAYNADTLTIVDVTDKSNPVMISRNNYPSVGYTHQGWLNEDHSIAFMNDETDEIGGGHMTRTFIWDTGDLASPTLLGIHEGTTNASDHNLYVHDGRVYEANYQAGLQILDPSDAVNGNLTQVAHFDTVPGSNSAGTSGAWSVYPYYESGNVVVSNIGTGMFILRPILCSSPPAPTNLSATAAGDNTIALDWDDVAVSGVSYDIYRAPGTCGNTGPFSLIAANVSASEYTDAGVSGQVPFVYEIRALEETRLCESQESDCASATTTGNCTAAPLFSGLTAIENPALAGCELRLSWMDATAYCGSAVTYTVYRDTDPAFTPGPGNQIAEAIGGLSYTDSSVESQVNYYYVVRATHTDNGAADINLNRIQGRATGPIADGTFMAGGETNDPALGAENDWSISTARSQSGTSSYFSGYENNLCAQLRLPTLQLSGSFTSTLSFDTYWDFEPRWDGGVLEISTNGGGSWNTLTPVEGYPSTFRDSSDNCGYVEDDPCFSGQGNWTGFTVDLAAYSGAEIDVRFNISTDGGAVEEGWYVDNITVTHVQVPSDCSTNCAALTALLEGWPTNTVLDLVTSVNCNQ